MIDRAEEVVDLARRHDVLLHSHAFVGSVDFAWTHYGEARVRRFLGPKTLFAHSNGLGPAEVAILGETGTGIAVVPYTHENLWYGPCPAVALLRAGANVTIATDGTAPYASYDLLRELPRAVWAQWSLLDDQAVLPPGKVLRMATIDAAHALGLGDEIGSLEVGKRADLILINLDRPHLTPQTNVPRQLVFFANGADVATVIVDGRTVLEDRPRHPGGRSRDCGASGGGSPTRLCAQHHPARRDGPLLRNERTILDRVVLLDRSVKDKV